MSEARTPRVSVVLVTYNRADQLPATLESLLVQSFRDFELIVSDDCSTDRTREVCAEYERRDSRVRYRRNPTNLRMPGNLNAALGEARGEYVAITHDGDLYREDLLEKWADALDRNPPAAFVFNGYRHHMKFGRRDADHLLEMPDCMDGREFLERIFIPNWGGCPVYGTTMVRKFCLDEVGPFDPRYSMHSDIEMWARLASRYAVAYVPEFLVTITPREAGHLLKDHYWWENTVDVRVKRLAFRTVYGRSLLRRLVFEWKARLTYAYQTLPMLKNRRWADAAFGLWLVASGRDDVPPPY